MSSAGPSLHLISGRHLTRNSAWNIAGQLLPMAVAVIAIPPIVKGLGVPRFGVLSLAWIVLGYFGLFDLGIGRALTKLIADKVGAGDEDSIPALAWTSLLLIFALGVAGGLVVAALSPWLVYRVLKISADLQTETLHTFYLLALAIPVVTLTSGLRGILEALHRFRVLNMIRIPMSVFSYAGALLVLPFSHSLVWVTTVLIVGRVIGCVIHLLVCLQALPSLRHHFAIHRHVIGPALRFGGWMTVTNIVGPFMVYLDRFVITALLSVGVLAYYTAPFDMVTRLLIVASAISGVLFPAFAVSLASDPARTGLLLSRGVKFTALAIFPVVLVVTALAPEGLRLWLGPVFAQNGTAVLRWLAIGVFVNSIAQVPFALVQSAGRPDLTAKLHLLELPAYLGAMWWLTLRLGIEGTAIAWTARVLVDAALLCLFAQRSLPRHAGFLARSLATLGGGVAVLALVTLPQSFVVRAVLTAAGLLALAVGGWFWALAPNERAILLPMLAGPEEAEAEKAVR